MTTNNTLGLEDDTSKTAYEFSFNDLNKDKELNLSEFKGKVMLIVNTASKCGFTSQYADLEKLYKEYKNEGLVIIGVPSNDFGRQEFETNEEITTFCKIKYGVTFLMTQKEKVSGEASHAFYKWAKERLGFGTAPKWNFHKYLINRKGKLIDYFNSATSPQSNRVKKAIEAALNDNILKASE